jgi:hypothetical protein
MPRLESSLLAKTVQHCGTARLNDKGECYIALPDSFPDPSLQINPLTATKRFTFVYHITPIGASMPGLYVSSEVHRWLPSNNNEDENQSRSAVELNRDTSRNGAGVQKVFGSEGNLLQGTQSKKIVTALSSGGAIVKSKSYSSLPPSAPFKHNDRIIDGPLPAYFEKKKKESNGQNHSLISPSSSSQSSSAPRVLCFSIAGGSPKGRVSWMVMTVPGEDQEEDARRLNGDDWRAIN